MEQYFDRLQTRGLSKDVSKIYSVLQTMGAVKSVSNYRQQLPYTYQGAPLARRAQPRLAYEEKSPCA